MSKVNTITATAMAALVFVATPVVAGTAIVSGAEVRNWQAIDVNKDNSISPEEMETFLKEIWARNTNKSTAETTRV